MESLYVFPSVFQSHISETSTGFMDLQTEAGLTCDPSPVSHRDDWHGAPTSCTCRSETNTKQSVKWIWMSGEKQSTQVFNISARTGGEILGFCEQ